MHRTLALLFVLPLVLSCDGGDASEPEPDVQAESTARARPEPSPDLPAEPAAGAEVQPESEPEPEPEPAAPTAAQLLACATGAADAIGTPGVVVHEAGTLSTFVGSDGEAVPGAPREASLPDFVQSKAPAESPLTRLHESVLWLHSEATSEVELVDTLDGEATEQWPPGIAGAGGQTSWQLTLGAGATTVEALDTCDVFTPLRRAATTELRAGDVVERFVLRGGASSWVLPSSVEDLGDHGRVVVEGLIAPLTMYFVHVHAGGALIKEQVLTGEVTDFQYLPTPKETNFQVFDELARAELASGLAAAGLTEAEALAVVDTWAFSAFQTWGRRVLILAPVSWLEGRIDTAITPAPEEHVRVYVARIEFMTETDELELTTNLDLWQDTKTTAEILEALGPFREAKLRRASALLEGTNLGAWVDTLVSSIGP